MSVIALQEDDVSHPIKCIICYGMLDIDTLSYITTDNCNHFLCFGCVRDYLNSILEKKISSINFRHINCLGLGCSEVYAATDVLLKLVFSKAETIQWWSAARFSNNNKEFPISTLQQEQIINCPFPDCDAIFVVDRDLTATCNFSVCYKCIRGLCITCQSRWHTAVIDQHETQQVEPPLETTSETPEQSSSNHFNNLGNNKRKPEEDDIRSPIYTKKRRVQVYISLTTTLFLLSAILLLVMT